MGWVNATSTTDPDIAWTNEADINDNTGTSATATAASTAWSSFIELNHAAIQCQKIQFYVNKNADQTTFDVDLYYDGGWQHLYSQVTHANQTWYEVSIGSTESVTAAQCRCFNTDGDNPMTMYIYGFQFYEVPLPEVAFTGSGTMGITGTTVEYGEVSFTASGTLNVISKLSNLIWPKFILEIHDSSGNLISILENAYDIRWVQELNKAHQLGFSLPIDDPKRADILLTNEIWLRNYRTALVERKFILSSTVEQRK